MVLFCFSDHEEAIFVPWRKHEVRSGIWCTSCQPKCDMPRSFGAAFGVRQKAQHDGFLQSVKITDTIVDGSSVVLLRPGGRLIII